MGLTEDVKMMKEQMIKDEHSKKKTRSFNIPFAARVSAAQKKKNWTTILKINENGQGAFSKQQITEQTIIEDGIPRLATTDHIIFIKKNPLIILPSWSVEPFSPPVGAKEAEGMKKPFNPKENLKESLENGSNTKGYKILMARMQSETVAKKMQGAGAIKWIIIAAVVGLIAYALMTGGA